MRTRYLEIKERYSPVLKRKTGPVAWKMVRFLFLVGLCYVFLFPVVYMLTISVRPPDVVNDPSSVWIPRELSLESIKIALRLMNYSRSFLLTLSISLLSTFASLISCSLVGYGFARFRFLGKNLLFGLLVLTIIIPPTTLVFSRFTILDSMQLTGTPFVFALPALFAVGLRSGIYVFIFRQFFAGTPKELEEAARIDGCGYLKTFVRIILPLAIPAFVTVGLFCFIWHWNDFYSSTMYFSGDVRPLPVMLDMLKTALKDAQIFNETYNTPDHIRTYLQAGSLFTILPILIIYVYTQRFFIESVERTGIVG